MDGGLFFTDEPREASAFTLSAVLENADRASFAAEEAYMPTE